MNIIHFFALTLHLQNRDVAQLVAHYVRDVGVGRSNRLIPTKKEVVQDGQPLFYGIKIICFSLWF